MAEHPPGLVRAGTVVNLSGGFAVALAGAVLAGSVGWQTSTSW
jgi:hypothetical protein